ncbi:hypothetical protein D9758_016447 [Tetrapyrgos nigripes]|uniref:Uncharacterized protein n=1 Tax=Tetrapyrgos nigripes TaxID=182062 RepID=A0A8H5CC27_9AGAR|nr:hypothetical protein D9758_016447 [Tetrapyrgos nigripes]
MLLRADLHIAFDNDMWCLLPSDDTLRKIFELIQHNHKRSDSDKPKQLLEEIPIPQDPKPIYLYRFTALRYSKGEAIHRRKIDFSRTTGVAYRPYQHFDDYTAHFFPFDDTDMQNIECHVHPFFVAYNLGMKMHRLFQVDPKLHDALIGLSEALQLAEDIYKSCHSIGEDENTEELSEAEQGAINDDPFQSSDYEEGLLGSSPAAPNRSLSTVPPAETGSQEPIALRAEMDHSNIQSKSSDWRLPLDLSKVQYGGTSRIPFSFQAQAPPSPTPKSSSMESTRTLGSLTHEPSSSSSRVAGPSLRGSVVSMGEDRGNPAKRKRLNQEKKPLRD